MGESDRTVLPLTIQLFGRVEIWAAGESLPPLRSRKGMWLVALLALRARQEVSREWLAVTLWPDSEDPLATLRRTLTDLRQALGPIADRIESLPGRQLRLMLPDEAIDVLEFDRAASAEAELNRLERALSLYRGPLLEECEEEWAVSEREARIGTFLRIAEQAADLYLKRQEPAVAATHLRAALEVAPLRESLCCALMRALAQCGKSSEAILAYHHLRQRLRREMNAEPSATTVACYRQILSEGRQKTTQGKTNPPGAVTASPALFRVPHPLTEMIGRETELHAIESGFSRSRLVTLTGGGGIGKTRLAIAAAQNLRESYPDGIWFIELARLSDPELVAQSIATTLKVREERERSFLESLIDFLQEKSALLMLDNCEHLIEACAQAVEMLLMRCSNLAILTTSRQPLGLNGEMRVPVPPLTIAAPDRNVPEKDLATTTLSQSPAVRLFVDRIHSVLPSFRLTPQNLPDILQLCAQLDGIPLALEMAAVRVKVMPIEQITARLKDRFRLLTSGHRTGLPHHQTLRSLIDWSYDLLSDSEGVLLRRLSVFVGGWTLESAEAVCADAEKREEREGKREEAPRLPPEDVLDLMALLVEKSLVQSEEEANGERRFRMLQTLREYATEKLQEASETDRIRKRHRDRFYALAEEAHAQMYSPDQNFWLEMLERDYDNIRHALRFCQQDPESGEIGLDLAAHMGDFWWIRGYLREGRGFVEAALNHPGGQKTGQSRALAMNVEGVIASYQGDFASAERALQDCVAMQRELGDSRQTAIVLGNLGSLYRDMGRYDQSRVYLEESLLLFRENNAPARAAISLSNLGGTALQQGDYAFARQCYEEAVALRRELGNPRGVALAQCGLGQVLMYLEEKDAALLCFEEAERIFREVYDRANLTITLLSMGELLRQRRELDAARKRVLEGLEICRGSQDVLIPALLNALAWIFQDRDEGRKAVILLGASASYASLYGMTLPAHVPLEAENAIRQLRESLGESVFESAWEEGTRMSVDEAIAFAQ